MATRITRRSVLSGMMAGVTSLSLSPNIYSRVGPLDHIVRLSSNENPYGPSKKVLIMPINYSIKLIEKTAKLTIKKISNSIK